MNRQPAIQQQAERGDRASGRITPQIFQTPIAGIAPYSMEACIRDNEKRVTGTFRKGAATTGQQDELCQGWLMQRSAILVSESSGTARQDDTIALQVEQEDSCKNPGTILRTS